jgi:hypothetical protein
MWLSLCTKRDIDCNTERQPYVGVLAVSRQEFSCLQTVEPSYKITTPMEGRDMTYNTPELLLIGAAQSLVLDRDISTEGDCPTIDCVVDNFSPITSRCDTGF